MIRRRARPQFHEPSLVPMADMLTNTVGVVLFILIFTVLTAGAAVLTKRLPIERPTKASPVEFICAGGRVVSATEVESAVKEFLRPLGTNLNDDFVTRFKNRTLETEYFVLTGEFNGSLFVLVKPKAVNTESSDQMAESISKFRSALAGLNPKEKYAKFFIYPSGVTAFRSAREIASSGTFGTGWLLFGAEEPIRYCVANCGSGGSSGTVE